MYYIDSLQETVDAREGDNENNSNEIYISIPEDKWDEFANDFSLQVYNNKADYKRNSFIISTVPVSYTHLDVYKRQVVGSILAYFLVTALQKGGVISMYRHPAKKEMKMSQ